MSLPPTGAKIRVTTIWPDGTKGTIEGIAVAVSESFVDFGAGHAAASLKPEDGSTVTVEVLELPEPADGTVYRCSRPIAGAVQPGAEMTWLLWRQDGWEANGDGRRWFKSYEGANVAFPWAEVQPEPGERRVLLVPDPAANAPEMPWQIGAPDAARLNIKPSRAGNALVMMAKPGDQVSAAMTLDPSECRAGAAVLLRIAADAEAGQR